jgi:hypothetical protein
VSSDLLEVRAGRWPECLPISARRTQADYVVPDKARAMRQMRMFMQLRSGW